MNIILSLNLFDRRKVDDFYEIMSQKRAFKRMSSRTRHQESKSNIIHTFILPAFHPWMQRQLLLLCESKQGGIQQIIVSEKSEIAVTSLCCPK